MILLRNMFALAGSEYHNKHDAESTFFLALRKLHITYYKKYMPKALDKR